MAGPVTFSPMISIPGAQGGPGASVFYAAKPYTAKKSISGQLVDGLTGLPVVGALVDAVVVYVAGLPSTATDPVNPRLPGFLIDQSTSGNGGWYSLDVTYTGQGIGYPARATAVSQDGTRTGVAPVMQAI